MYDLFGKPMDMPENLFAGYDPWPPDEITRDEMDIILQTEISLETTAGEIRLRLYADHSPLHAANFIRLIQAGFFENLPIHSVEPGIKVCCGRTDDPSLQYKIPKEIVFEHIEGSIGMAAESDDPEAPSSGTEFYFVIADDSCSDLNKSHTVFGRVVAGRDVLKSLRDGSDSSKPDLILKAGCAIPWSSPQFGNWPQVMD